MITLSLKLFKLNYIPSRPLNLKSYANFSYFAEDLAPKKDIITIKNIIFNLYNILNYFFLVTINSKK